MHHIIKELIDLKKVGDKLRGVKGEDYALLHTREFDGPFYDRMGHLRGMETCGVSFRRFSDGELMILKNHGFTI